MSLLERRPVGDLLEFQDFSEVRPLGDHLSSLSVVRMEELTKGQHRKLLSLDEVLATELGGVQGERFLAHRQGCTSEIQCGLGHGRHGLCPPSMTYRSALS